ncbi:MAG: FAD-dependent oxidoreductase [Rhodospirillaceae bacterium]
MNVIAPPRRRIRIAIVGTGIAGMSAAWLLDQGHDITVYEGNPWIGGHSNTVDAESGGATVPVDTGFIVYNERNYPNLTALFAHLGVPTKPSEMSFAASLDGGGFEYAGTNINGMLGQRRNALRPRFWRMVKDIVRFYRAAPALLDEPGAADLSLSDFLARERYDARFIDDHLLPMGAAIWSTTAAEMAAYPAQAFVRFFHSHGLLELVNRPEWRTVHGGSREYVLRLTGTYRHKFKTAGVTGLTRFETGVRIEDEAGDVNYFDHVVLACHADQALRLMNDPDDMERELLGAWRYTPNRAVLHTDASLMPKRRAVWSSWNFIAGDEPDANRPLCVTYWMNRLQGLRTERPLFVTLNPTHAPAAETILREFDYTHPFFDRAAMATQRRLWSLQGRRRTWFCGSYFGYGFHEDALQSGLAVAEQLGGIARPWQVAGESGRIHVGSPAAVADAVA